MTDAIPVTARGRRAGYRSPLRYLALPVVFLAGCTTPDVMPGHGQPVDDVRLHALMTDRISVLSDQLDALMFEQHRTESELDALRSQRSAQVAAAAARLQQSARRLGETLPPQTGPLASPERFSALAGQLAEHAGDLAQLAREERVERYQAVAARIKATCDTCHGLYRDR